MSNPLRKWTKEKVQEMKDWQVANGKTNKETAEHFKLSSDSAYSQMKTNYLGKQGNGKNGKKRGPKVGSKMKPRKSIAVMEIPVAEAELPNSRNASRPIALAFIPPDQFSRFMSEFYGR